MDRNRLNILRKIAEEDYPDLLPMLDRKASFSEAWGEVFKGDAGYTPVKGVDYFTDQEAADFLDMVRPVKGEDYFTAEDISSVIEKSTPIKGVHYSDGAPGAPGRNGTSVDVEDVVSRIMLDPVFIGKIKGKDGNLLSAKDIVTKLNTLEEAIEAKVIKGLPTITDFVKEIKRGGKHQLDLNDVKGAPLDMRWHGGGLSSVVHDSTLTGSGTTASPLSVVGSGGVNYETPVGLINDSNVTFTVSHTPKAVILNGTMYFENDGYTLSGLTITMLVVPVSGSTLRSQY